MEHSYSMHGHTRSLSSLASTIVAVTSEPSPFTSVTASPMDPPGPDDLPIELKIPLPTSSAGSDEDEEGRRDAAASAQASSQLHEGVIRTTPRNSIAEGREHILRRDEEPGQSPNPPSMSLRELAQLAGLEAYQKRQTFSVHARLKRLRMSCGLDKRLISTFAIAYGDMIDQYKTDDQAGFAGLYEACEQLKSSCNAASRTLMDTGSDTEEARVLPNERDGRGSIETLPLEDRENIVTFLTRIRTEPDFLSERISHLPSAGLTALTSSYHPAGIDFSILQNHSHGKSQFFSKDSQMMKLSRRMDNIHWFHNQDPFFTLLYGVFDPSATPGSHEYWRRTDIWSAACAKTMVEGFNGSRPGSDELAIASLDAFANFQEWPLKPNLEVYLMSILVKGAFLVEPPASQPINFKEPMETHNAKAAIAETDFFEDALSDLFNLLTADDVQYAVPTSALTFAHAVLRRIEDPKLRLRAQHFIVIRWYFATFISSIANYPEVRGIMMTQHIGETARRVVLQKLVVKMQERVFDAILPWNESTLVNPTMRGKITSIFEAFTPSLTLQDHNLPSRTLAEDEIASTRLLMLSPMDIIGLVQLLCMDRASSLGSTEAGTTVPVSDRPSTGGSSTLVAGSSDVGSVLPNTGKEHTSGESCLCEIPTTGTATEIKDTSHSPKGELHITAQAKNIPRKEFDSNLRFTCQKLKTTSARNRCPSPSDLSAGWAFFYYSKDGLTLAMEPIGITATTLTSPVSTTDPQHEKGSKKTGRLGSYHNVKMAAMNLLRGFDGDPEILEKSSIPGESKSTDPYDMLGKLMEGAMAKAHSGLDFTSAHMWWKNFQQYQEYLDGHSSKQSLTLFQDLREDLQAAVDAAVNVARCCDTQCQSLTKLQKHNKKVLAKMEELRSSLRIKMWYVSDVRHSATYEEALYVSRSLRTMASSRRYKQPGNISSWARSRLRGSAIPNRAEAQCLEAMAAPREHGGLSKIADEQVELSSRWLTRRSIENFCKGEERIHRFCFEIQRSVGRIAGFSLLESPVLWSSNLFKRERFSFDTQRSRIPALNSPLSSSFIPPTPSGSGNLHTRAFGVPGLPPMAGSTIAPGFPTNSFGGFWSISPPRQSAGLGLYGSHPILPPTPTSPPMSWLNNPLAPGSSLHAIPPPTVFGSTYGADHAYRQPEAEESPAKKIFVDQTKEKLRSLLISDLGFLLWNQGSETDAWVNDHIQELERGERVAEVSKPLTSPDFSLGGASSPPDDILHQAPSSDKNTSAMTLGSSQKNTSSNRLDSFPFSESYATLLRSISLTHDPQRKLQLLYELHDLVIRSMDNRLSEGPRKHGSMNLSWHHGDLNLRSRSVPRTKATSLEEVIANCTERRTGTLKSQISKATSPLSAAGWGSADSSIPGTDDTVNALYSLFRTPKLRPTTLFRDLQYISAFIPAETLDRTALGKAFWDAGLAALALKEDLCESITSRASDITTFHMSSGASLTPAADQALTSTTLRDAANLWLIAAKEGSPMAARELGLFYLTHPELLRRVTMPFSKASDVFKSVRLHDTRAGDKEKGALDPYTFAVVFHWMEIAANGGDKDARDFLKGNGELSSGW